MRFFFIILFTMFALIWACNQRPAAWKSSNIIGTGNVTGTGNTGVQPQQCGQEVESACQAQSGTLTSDCRCDVPEEVVEFPQFTGILAGANCLYELFAITDGASTFSARLRNHAAPDANQPYKVSSSLQQCNGDNNDCLTCQNVKCFLTKEHYMTARLIDVKTILQEMLDLDVKPEACAPEVSTNHYFCNDMQTTTCSAQEHGG